MFATGMTMVWPSGSFMTSVLFIIVPRSLSAKVLYQVFPLHEKERLDKLKKGWVKQIFERQPIGEIIHNLLIHSADP